jgi:hypothetical protein
MKLKFLVICGLLVFSCRQDPEKKTDVGQDQDSVTKLMDDPEVSRVLYDKYEQSMNNQKKSFSASEIKSLIAQCRLIERPALRSVLLKTGNYFKLDKNQKEGYLKKLNPAYYHLPVEISETLLGEEDNDEKGVAAYFYAKDSLLALILFRVSYECDRAVEYYELLTINKEGLSGQPLTIKEEDHDYIDYVLDSEFTSDSTVQLNYSYTSEWVDSKSKNDTLFKETILVNFTKMPFDTLSKNLSFTLIRGRK